jgi:hypothetical protein
VLPTWSKNWPILALGGVFFAAVPLVFLSVRNSFWFFTTGGTIVMGEFAFAAGICALAIGLRSRKGGGEYALLVFTGAALAILGILFCRPLHYVRVGLIVAALVALGLGALELLAAATLARAHRFGDGLLLGIAGLLSGAVSIRLVANIFDMTFVILGGAVLPMGFFLLICNFGVTAICILALLLRLRGKIGIQRLLKGEDQTHHRLLRFKPAIVVGLAGLVIFLLSPAVNYGAAYLKAHVFRIGHPEIRNVAFEVLDLGSEYKRDYRYTVIDSRTDQPSREHLVLTFENLGVIETHSGDPVAKVLSSGCLDFSGVPLWAVAGSIGLLCAGFVMAALALAKRAESEALV